MSRYQDWLVEYIETHPDFIRPERYRNEVLSFLKEPLEDLCISRPKSRLEWGISLPFDDKYVTYVWFDALLNYVSAVGYPEGPLFGKFWPEVQHIVAKDILKPHGIYWPIMLKAAGIPIYRHLNVHGYWNVDHSKMSKSLGNVIEPLELKNIYGLDAFRYFLMREMVFGLDSGFSETALIGRINADLANDLGNLFSRVIAMTHKFFKGVVPAPDLHGDPLLTQGLRSDAAVAVREFEAGMSGFMFHKALVAVWEFISQMNKYIDVTTPWVLAKSKSTIRQLETVIYNLLEGLRIISGLIFPVMPETAASMQRHLGQKPGSSFYRISLLSQWGGLASGTVIPKSVTLFPRIDVHKKDNESDDASAPPPERPVFKSEISLEEFKKIDLRIGRIVKAEAVPKAKKLLKLEVDIGEIRTIVAGIAGSYSPESLVGKQVIVLANLQPAKLMGILSQGMLLAAVDDNRCTVATVDGVVKPGTALS
jgi:methionyl-tRNA synthetase